ncbi:hypothetical protein [Methanolobus psychrotolerans]|uniref:hypothetical protein n=1 Tax=Methanolobus psychrotolerans TaxID=1874706 RepID=UPI000B91AC5F|nr:hypothetical protein [Methanolobus psychrotolerans]
MVADMIPAGYEGLLLGLECEELLVQQPVGQLIMKKDADTCEKYAYLRDMHKPLGVAEYKLAQSLPDDQKGNLPTIEELEKELGEVEEVEDDE